MESARERERISLEWRDVQSDGTWHHGANVTQDVVESACVWCCEIAFTQKSGNQLGIGRHGTSLAQGIKESAWHGVSRYQLVMVCHGTTLAGGVRNSLGKTWHGVIQKKLWTPDRGKSLLYLMIFKCKRVGKLLDCK